MNLAKAVSFGRRRSSVIFVTVALLGSAILAGCDDNVEVIRDPDIRVTKGMTWAWRPMNHPATANQNRDSDTRPVASRDVIAPAPQQRLESNRDWNTEANRKQLEDAIEKGLASRGLVQVPDAATADFLVDYHVAVKTQRATVGTVYPGWGWYGWGWGPPEVYYQNVRWHEGTFVFDLTLRNPKKLAYRAISQKELNNKHTISPYQAEQAVNHLLKGLKAQ